MSYKFIYFDLDDTLLDHRSAERSGLTDVYQHFSLFSDVALQELFDTYHQVNSVQWRQYSRGEVTREQLQRNRFEQTLQQLRLNEKRYAEIGHYYLQCYRQHWQWIDGAADFYQRICKYYPVGILTNGFAETQRKKFEDFNFYHSAEHIVISEEVGALKPDPRVFHYATEITDFTADEILYVGDSYTSDIEGGHHFGWKTAWFTTDGGQDNEQKADVIFSDYKDLMNLLKV